MEQKELSARDRIAETYIAAWTDLAFTLSPEDARFAARTFPKETLAS